MLDRGSKIGILYWGKRGGGKVLADQLFWQADFLDFDVTFFTRPLGKRENRGAIPIYYFWRWIFARKEVITRSLALDIQTMVLPMASPWDIFIGKKLMKYGIKVTRIVHDASPHPGDIFPPKFWIRLLCLDSDRIITLSKYVASQLVSLGYAKSEKIVIGKLPNPVIPALPIHESRAPRTSFLFIGRGRTYKGLDLLLTSWPTVGDKNSRLVVAGEGHVISSLIPRVTHVDRWLSDLEVLEFINECDVVVLPYMEASQSGIISISHALGRPVVITPVGGLSEQIDDGINGIISKTPTAASLAQALNDAINYNFDLTATFVNSPENFLINLCVNRTNL